MCDHIAYCERNELNAEIDRLRAELAHARLERDNIAALNSSLIAGLAAAKARIAELETDHLFAENKRLREACQEFRARAERAEAERDAMREFLEGFREAEARVLDIIDAALAPPVLIDDLGQVWPEDAPAPRHPHSIPCRAEVTPW